MQELLGILKLADVDSKPAQHLANKLPDHRLVIEHERKAYAKLVWIVHGAQPAIVAGPLIGCSLRTL
jgi:hypothetical protein